MIAPTTHALFRTDRAARRHRPGNVSRPRPSHLTHPMQDESEDDDEMNLDEDMLKYSTVHEVPPPSGARALCVGCGRACIGAAGSLTACVSSPPPAL